MRTFLAAAALSLACVGWCRADETIDGASNDRPSTMQIPGVQAAFSPALLNDLEQILQAILAGAGVNDRGATNSAQLRWGDAKIDFKLAALDDDDDEDDERPGRRRSEEGRREDDRREKGRREGDRDHERRHGDRREGDRGPEQREHDSGRRGGDHPPHFVPPGGPGAPGFGGPGGGPAPNPHQPPHQGPGPGGPGGPGGHPHDGAPHTINVHIFLHHDFGGGPATAMRMLMSHGRPGEMHGSPPGHRAGRHDGNEEEEDEEEMEEELESLRNEVTALRKEVSELSKLMRQLAEKAE